MRQLLEDERLSVQKVSDAVPFVIETKKPHHYNKARILGSGS